MTKLETMKLAIYERADSGEINEEEKVKLLEMVEEKYGEEEEKTEPIEITAEESCVIDYILSNEMTIEEGVKILYTEANSSLDKSIATIKKEAKDINKTNDLFKKTLTKTIDEYKENMQLAKKLMSDKKYDSAIKVVNKAKTKLTSAKQLIQNTDTNILDDVAGFLSANLKGIFMSSTVAALIMNKFYNADFANSFIKGMTFQTCISLFRELVKGKSINSVKNNAIKIIDTELANIEKLKKEIDKAVKKSKN